MPNRPNTVELVGYYGGDQTHAQAAWTSTQIKGREDRIPGLLKMLAENEHGTPFERSLLHFNATVDTATHIHLLKHRHFSINGESARYKEYVKDKYYIPQDWCANSQRHLADVSKNAYKAYHLEIMFAGINSALGRKRAKESARYFLPYATQVNLDFSCNFRAFQHFQKLRNSEHAQLEIKEIAQEMLRLVQEKTNGDFQHTLTAWGLGKQ